MRNTVFLATLVLVPQMAVPDEPNMVQLAGTPEQIGMIWGQRNKEIIRRDLETGYLKRAAAAGISRETLIGRSAASVEIMGQIAPHWLQEARAVARAADAPEDLYLAFLDGAVLTDYREGDVAIPMVLQAVDSERRRRNRPAERCASRYRDARHPGLTTRMAPLS